MKIAVITCAYKRPHVFDIFLTSFKRNLEYMYEHGFDFKLFVGGDWADDDGVNLNACLSTLKQHEFTWVNYPNKPLSNKWNATLNKAIQEGFDYALILGSDDIIDNDFLRSSVLNVLDMGYVGVSDFYLVNTNNLSMKKWIGYQNDRKGESIGAGRMIDLDILQSKGFKGGLWEEGLNKGLDASMTNTLKGFGMECSVTSCNDTGVLIDVKSDTNIWSYESFIGDTLDGVEEIITSRFGKDVWQKMMKFRNNAVGYRVLDQIKSSWPYKQNKALVGIENIIREHLIIE